MIYTVYLLACHFFNYYSENFNSNIIQFILENFIEFYGQSVHLDLECLNVFWKTTPLISAYDIYCLRVDFTSSVKMLFILYAAYVLFFFIYILGVSCYVQIFLKQLAYFVPLVLLTTLFFTLSSYIALPNSLLLSRPR